MSWCKVSLWLWLPGPCRAHVGLFGRHHWPSHPVPGAGCLSKGGPWLVPVLLLAIFGSADDHRAGRAMGENTNHFQCVTSLSSHRKVSNGVFTLSPAYIFACISSASHPTQNQPFLGQHHPAFSGSVSGNGVTIHIWVIAVGKQLHPHKSLVITTSSY